MRGGGGEGGRPRGPQSLQSVPNEQREYAELGPPSSHPPSLGHEQVLVHVLVAPVPPGGDGEGDAVRGGGGEGGRPRGPQSLQSVPNEQREYAELGPPSSHPPSLGHEQVLVHVLVAPVPPGPAWKPPS